MNWDEVFDAIESQIKPGTEVNGQTITEVLVGALVAVLSTAPEDDRMAWTHAAVDRILARVSDSFD